MYKKIIFFIVCVSSLLPSSKAQIISSTFNAQNYWLPNRGGYGGQLENYWDTIAASGVKYMRIGGISYDGTDMWSNVDLISIIDEMRSYGIEPIIQVPIDTGKTIPQNANDAVVIVTAINVTNNKGIKYWEIGNEPNVEYACSRNYDKDTAIAHYIKDVSTAMKGVSGQSTFIKIIGPSFSYYDYSRYRKLIGGVNNIAGSGPNGYYIDYIDFHIYPFQNQCYWQTGTQNCSGSSPITRTDVINNINANDQLREILDTINSRIGIAGRTGTLKASITEANISYEQNTSDKLVTGIGPGSYLAGQYWAETMGTCMEKGVGLLAFWSAIEGYGGNNYLGDIGYISSEDSIERSSYWHYKMIADNFKETYLPNLYTGNASTHKVFAYKNATTNQIGVLIMNQDLQSPRGTDTTTVTFAINFNNSNPSTLKTINVKLNGASSPNFPEYYCRIKNETSQLLVFNSNGTLAKNQVYSLGEALIDSGPVDVSGTNDTLYTQSDFNTYIDVVHHDIFIQPNSSHITEGTSDNKTFRFSNGLLIGGGAGDFTVPVGGELLLTPAAASCN